MVEMDHEDMLLHEVLMEAVQQHYFGAEDVQKGYGPGFRKMESLINSYGRAKIKHKDMKLWYKKWHEKLFSQ
jgi:hypothetical protein